MLAWSAKGLLCHEKLQLLSSFGLLSSVGIHSLMLGSIPVNSAMAVDTNSFRVVYL